MSQADLQYALANQQAIGGSNPYAKAYAGIKDVLSAPFAYRTVIDPATNTPRRASDVYGYTPNLDTYNAKEQGASTGIQNALTQMTPSAKAAQAQAASSIASDALNPADLTSQFTNPAQGTPSSTATSSGPTIDAAKALGDKLAPPVPTPLSDLSGDGGLGNLLNQMNKNKTAVRLPTPSPIINDSSDYDALIRTPEKTAADFIAERKARLGDNPALATRQDKIDKMEAENKSAEEQSPWMALMKAGLATMGGTSQYAGVNIGKGGEAGLDDYIKSQDKIITRKDKTYDLFTQLGDAKRQEDLAAEAYGENSKQALDARNDTAKLASITHKHAVEEYNAKDAQEVKKTTAMITSSDNNAQLAAQVQVGVAKAGNDLQKQIADMTQKNTMSIRTADLYNKATAQASARLKTLIGDKGVDAMGNGVVKTVSEANNLYNKLLAEEQASLGLSTMIPSTSIAAPSLPALDAKSAAQFHQ
jgi:hypothetical protein